MPVRLCHGGRGRCTIASSRTTSGRDQQAAGEGDPHPLAGDLHGLRLRNLFMLFGPWRAGDGPANQGPNSDRHGQRPDSLDQSLSSLYEAFEPAVADPSRPKHGSWLNISIGVSWDNATATPVLLHHPGRPHQAQVKALSNQSIQSLGLPESATAPLVSHPASTHIDLAHAVPSCGFPPLVCTCRRSIWAGWRQSCRRSPRGTPNSDRHG